jgi:DNA repair exonuclease SbcCD nuclease subunit
MRRATSATCPCVLLPGNHDAATVDSALLRLELPASVKVRAKGARAQFDNALIHLCPLPRRHETDGPTRW